MMKDEHKETQRALIKLYQTLKIRKEEETKGITKEKLQEEEIALQTLPLKTLVMYIKSSIDIKIALEVENQCQVKPNTLKSDNDKMAQYYETLLRKEEKAIREHISMEHQLKIYVESVEQKLEEAEHENNLLKHKLKKYTVTEDKEKKQSEDTKRKEIENLKKVIQTLEDQKGDWAIRENKLISQLNQRDKEIKRLEAKIVMRRSASLLIHKDKNIEKYIDKDRDRDNDISSHSSSMCSNSRSKRKITDDIKYRTEGHEISLGKDKSCSVILSNHYSLKDKLEKYSQSFAKKQNECTRNKGNYPRSVSNISNSSYLTKTNDNYEQSKKANRNEITQRLNETTLKDQKTVQCIMGPNTISMKKIPLPNCPFVKKAVVSSTKKRQSSVNGNGHNRNNHSNISESMSHKRVQASTSAIPIVINQSEVPCVNNFNIYNAQGNHENTIQMSSSHRADPINLRQFIFSKGETQKMKKMRTGQHNKY